ncbi:hypothetical protein B0H10DRAFT_1966207 [Mycena sp. CBHHK59/15]|nr:hypothetical protein B0H10DRAFT_1966207 [Mycena sp. CBHHK59/15]
MARRATVTSAKAVNAAAIAAAEAQDDLEKPAKKPRGRPKKVNEPELAAVNELEETNDKAASGAWENKIHNILIECITNLHDISTTRTSSWTTDLDLTWTFITAIEDDKETLASLFPGVGAIKLSGRKRKTHYCYKLTVISMFCQTCKVQGSVCQSHQIDQTVGECPRPLKELR